MSGLRLASDECLRTSGVIVTTASCTRALTKQSALTLYLNKRMSRASCIQLPVYTWQPCENASHGCTGSSISNGNLATKGDRRKSMNHYGETYNIFGKSERRGKRLHDRMRSRAILCQNTLLSTPPSFSQFIRCFAHFDRPTQATVSLSHHEEAGAVYHSPSPLCPGRIVRPTADSQC